MKRIKKDKCFWKRNLFSLLLVLLLSTFIMGCSVDTPVTYPHISCAEILNQILIESDSDSSEGFDEVIKMIKSSEELINNLNHSKNSKLFFVWEEETNQIIVVKINEESNEGEVVFSIKEGYGELDNSWYFIVTNDEDEEKINALGEANVINVFTYFEQPEEKPEIEKVTITTENAYVTTEDNSDLVVDLEGKEVVSEGLLDTVPFQALKGSLTINGGTIEAEGKIEGFNGAVNIGVGNDNPNLVLNGTKVNGEGGVAVFAPSTLDIIGNPQIEMNGAELTANTALLLQVQGEATLTETVIEADTLFSMSHGATVVVKSGKYIARELIVWLNNHADADVLGFPMTSLQIEGGEFIFPENTRVFNFRTNGRGGIEAIITGGTFNGKAFNEITETEWKALCTGDVKVEGALTDYIRITFPKKETVKPTIQTSNDLIGKVNNQGTQSLTVGKDLELTGDQSVLVNNNDANITVDLGTNKVTGNELTGLPFQVAQGSLTINGGTIEAEAVLEGYGAKVNIGVGNEDSKLVLNDTKVNGSKETVAVFAPSTLDINGSPEIEMNGAEINAGVGILLQAQGEATLTDTTVYADTLFSMSHGAKIVVKSGKYVVTELIVWLNNHANAAELGFPMTSLQIEGGEFIFPEGVRVFNFRTNGRGGIEAIITGGTFNGKAFNQITETEWKALCTGDVKVEGALTDYIRIIFPKK